MDGLEAQLARRSVSSQNREAKRPVESTNDCPRHSELPRYLPLAEPGHVVQLVEALQQARNSTEARVQKKHQILSQRVRTTYRDKEFLQSMKASSPPYAVDSLISRDLTDIGRGDERLRSQAQDGQARFLHQIINLGSRH